ncbi:hypothetical protein AX16_010427 [Volvariella volvacea WC 439]|nr:hypothetical protein AX16_010427 [Volvariella volvacea WC 439]
MAGTQPVPKVLIVGGGPAGLVLAITLLQNHVPVRIIEKTVEPRLGQRGAGIMPRSLELFKTLRINEAVEKIAISTPPVRTYEMPAGVKPLHTFEMAPLLKPTPACPYLNIVLLGQDRLEKIFHAVLAQYGCRVEKGTELTNFQQSENYVEVKLRVRGDGSAEGAVEETTRFDWVIGTDGARGVVRKMLGLSFLGETRNIENLVVGDICVRGLSSSYWHMWGDAHTTLISLRPTETPGLFNFMVAGRNINHRQLSSDQNALLRCFIENTGGRPDLSFGPIPWMSHYTPNIRMVDKFGYGRVYIAGDAGHVHSPTGGQGMNASIQDSWNLGWKLALVAKGLASRTLIDSYTEERIPVIAEVLDRTTKILNRTFHEKDDSVWKTSPSLMQLGVNYRWSSIVLDEQKKEELTPEEIEYNRIYGLDDSDSEDEALGSAYGSSYDRRLRAGDRAPDAPNLEDAYQKHPPRRLFDIYGSHFHTVLCFTSSKAKWEQVSSVVSRYAAGIVRAGLILRPGSVVPKTDGADFVLIDRKYHAHGGYDICDSCWIVVVRPDGFIGGILAGAEGLERYFSGIFGKP